MNETIGILYYFIIYFLEFIKFFLVDKYILGWKEKKRNCKRMLVALSGLLGMAFFIFFLSEQINPLIFYALFLIIETILVFEEITWKLVCVTITEIYAIGAIDAMIQQMYAIILELLESNLKFPLELIVSTTTILFLVIIIYAMRNKMQGYISRIPIQYYIIFICLDTGNGILLGEFKRNLVNGNMGLRIVFIFMVLGVFLELALLLLLAATGEIYKEKDFLNQKYLKLQESHYKYLEQRETATKKFRHDMRNHIYILQHLLEQGKTKEAKQYAGQMEQRFNALGTPISVNHGIVDAILNKYATECDEKNIDLSIKGYMPRKCKISSFDLCVIFSNLLSNAIEATENCTKKQIRLELRHEEETFMLCIRNSFDGKLIKKNGNIQTRKQDKEIHGYGLLNVKECVERNQGHIHIQQQKAEFVVTIFLKVEGKSSIETGKRPLR